MKSQIWNYVTLLLAYTIGLTSAQETSSCYGPGSIATSVILTFILTVLLLGSLRYLWSKYKSRKENHLILETDPEKGKGEYAFDNPGFKDTSVLSVDQKPSKSKWNQWSPLSGLITKSEKRKTLDDTALEDHPVKVVALQSHDFTGLGFNICGNMKDGIYIKDVLHRGPAFESGKLSPGDRINSVTISFEHMVYEDALTILSYASPYEVILEAKSGKLVLGSAQGQGAQPSHPVYRSASCAELHYGEKSKKRLFTDDHSGSMSGSNSSSLQKSHLPHKNPKPKYALTPEQLRHQLEQKIISTDHQKLEHKLSSDQQKFLEQNINLDHHHNFLKAKEKFQQKSSETNKDAEKPHTHQKFGVRVLPIPSAQQISPKIKEQNENNINIEKNISIDEVDESKKPQIKPREKKSVPESSNFERNNSLIKRDENGIPQEIPNFMLDAALAARKNRKNSKEELIKETPKKHKGKAPSPPEENGQKIEFESDADQIKANTIELDASDITIHESHETKEEQNNRRTASTGDLTKMNKTTRSNVNGTLERAQSLDISTDVGSKNDESTLIHTEPRLSLILDGLNTFQRNKLKKSTEWGNLEDAIVTNDDSSTEEFEALVNKINEIKREEIDVIPQEVIDIYAAPKVKQEVTVNNQIWPGDNEEVTELQVFANKRNKKNINGEDKKPPIRQRSPIVDLPENVKIDKISEVIVSQKPDEIESFSTKQIEIEKPICQRIPSEDRPKIPLPIQKEENVIEPIKNEEETLVSKIPIFLNKSQNLETYTIELNTDESQNVEDKTPTNKKEEKQTEIKDKLQNYIFELSKNNEPIIKEWDVSHTDMVNISPPPSLNVIDDVSVIKQPENRIDSEYLLSKIPALKTDKNKKSVTETFLANEQLNSALDTNISDDIKVSRHQNVPKSDDAKSQDIGNVVTIADSSLHHSMDWNVNEQLSERSPHHNLELSINEQSNKRSIPHNLELSVNDQPSERSLTTIINEQYNERPLSHSVDLSLRDQGVERSLSHNLELSINETLSEHSLPHSLDVSVNEQPSELYTTALENNLEKVTISTPDLIKNVTLTEAITAVNKFSEDEPSLTYVTEIQVTPTNKSESNINVSEIEIVANGRNLETEFENYVKNFDEKLEKFEHNMENFDTNLAQFIKEEPTSIIINDNVEKEVHKIQEIAEEQFKKLPEMRFTTSSYESEVKTPEKRHSFEQIRSNFEKTPPKTGTTPPKSRIPIATTAKTPPTSPERRDSRNLDNETDKAAILELMSSSVHSTPFSKIKPPGAKSNVTVTSKNNVTVTSIRSNSKIPSGLPRPPIAPRKSENDDHVVHLSTNGTGGFKEWVFTPSGNNVSNVTVDK